MTAGMIPSRTSVKPKTASGQATAMSAQATSPEPPPSAKPWTQQTTGAGQRSIDSSIRYSRIASSTFSSYERSIAARCHSTSAPAQNAGPSPVEEHRARVADVRERVGQLRDERGVEGVAAFGLRERHAEDVPVTLHLQRRHAQHPMVSEVAAKRFTAELERVGKTSARVPGALRSEGSVRPRAAPGEGHDRRPHVADDTGRVRRRGLHRAQPRGTRGGRSRCRRPRSRGDGAGHRAPHGRAARGSPGGTRGGARRACDVPGSLVHAPP